MPRAFAAAPGILVFFLGAAAFFAVVAGFDGPAKGTLYPWGLAAVALGAIAWPLGWVLNRRRNDDNSHDFMFIPMQYWGALFLLGGVAMLGVHFGMNRDAPAEEPCAELSELLYTCGGAATMFPALCLQSAPDVQTSCLSCVRASADPCSPGGCRSACGL